MNEPTITIAGNLTQDPELRFTNTGKPVALLRVASTPRRYDNDTRTWVEGNTTFLDAETWGAPGENAADSLRRGDRVLITGKLRADVWTPETGQDAGIEQRRLRIVVDELAVSLRYAPARPVRAGRRGLIPAPGPDTSTDPTDLSDGPGTDGTGDAVDVGHDAAQAADTPA